MVFFTLSCGDDFTTVDPVGALSDDALANAEGVDLLLTGAYSTLDGIRLNQGAAEWTASGDNWWFDVISDDAHKGSTDGDQADLFELETFNWATGNPYIFGRWNALFAGVNRANAVIALIGTLEGDGLDAQLAEARFLRGHYNFELQKIYGNVPYISEENYANTEFNQPNSGPIWNEIEADFTFAAANLPSAGDQETGRATSGAARAYLGKAHLYQGEWDAAFTELNAVVTSGDYALLPEYVDNFALGGENGTESIFAIQFAADGGNSFNGNRGGTLNYPIQGPATCCGFYQPTQDLVNAFQTDGTGLPLLTTFNQTDVTNDYGIEAFEADADGNVITDADGNPIPTDFTPHTGPLDPRLDYTVGRRGIQYNGYGVMTGKDWIRASFQDISGPYLPKKNIYQAAEADNQGTGAWGQQHAGINYNIIRYADVLLMAAEAAVELGDVATALAYVNEVRQRAATMTVVQDEDGNPAANYEISTYTAFASQDEARQAVRFERRLELGMEGHRLFDLRRWGNAMEVINAYAVNEQRTITPFSPNAYESRFDLLPIPLNAIDLSGNTLTQNPGF